MTSAELCRRNGWAAGDVLEGTESGNGWSCTSRILITAVGEDAVLAREIASRKGDGPWEETGRTESGWSLRFRDWRRVDP
jgi:hypothetical protein